MRRVSILLCMVLLVTLGVVVSVSFANNIEVKSKDVKSKESKNVDDNNKNKEQGQDDKKIDDDDDDDKKKKEQKHKKDDQDDVEKKNDKKKKSDDHGKNKKDDDDDEKKKKDDGKKNSDDDKKKQNGKKKSDDNDKNKKDDDDDDDEKNKKKSDNDNGKKQNGKKKKDDHDNNKKDNDEDEKKKDDGKKKSDADNDKDGNESDDDDDDKKTHKNKNNEEKDDDDDDDNDSDDDDDEIDGDDKEKEKMGTYELKKGNLTVKFTNWGASIMSLQFPDKNGKSGDIVLGYDSVKDYKNDTVYFGATVGRVANRIAKAQFKLNGKEYKTSVNEGKNTLHGGKKGLSDVAWEVPKHKYDGKEPFIVFAYTSPDGDQGFPGELDVMVTYKLVGDNELSLEMEAKAKDKETPVNLAHHSYWNLGGHNNGDILSEEIQILGSSYTPVDDELIPTGKISPVNGTPYDFLQLRPIKDKIKDLKAGYDINYCLDGDAKKMRKVVELVDKKSGRKMELFGNQPGLQFYTGGLLKNVKGKNGSVYKTHAGLCLETQGYPNSVNYPNFPSQVVKPGQKYKNTMRFKFSIVS